MFVRFKLYGQKEYVGSVFIYESDDLNDAKNHYEEVEVDLEFVSATIIDTTNWSVVSYMDFRNSPRNNGYVKKIGIKRENIRG